MECWLPYYEVTGSGPCLVLLESGLSDANASAASAAALQDTYTVIRLDRRGLSRSADRAPDGTIEEHSRDVLAVLDHVAPSQRAAVFGVSIGALIALNLAQNAGARFSFIGIHEPPLEALVEWPRRAKGLDEVERLAAHDPMAAIRAMGRIVQSGDVREYDAPVPTEAGDARNNVTTFLAADFTAVRGFRPQLDRLRATPSLHISGGQHCRGRFEYESARELSRRVSLPFTELPVGHSALSDFPRATANYLKNITHHS